MRSLIYLIRHGEIDVPSPRRFLGQTDLPLTPNGIRQAQALHTRLQSIAFTHVFTSPLQRAVQTATLVSGSSPESLHLIDAFKELNLGDWEGLTVDEIRSRFPGQYERRGPNLEHFRPWGGESFRDLANRCLPALIDLAERYPGPLLITAHSGVNRVILSHLLQRPLQELLQIPQDFCAVNILRRTPDSLQVEAINLNLIDY